MRITLFCVSLMVLMVPARGQDLSSGIFHVSLETDTGTTRFKVYLYKDRFCVERMINSDTVRQMVHPGNDWMLTYAGGADADWGVRTQARGLPDGRPSTYHGFAAPMLEMRFTGEGREQGQGHFRQVHVRYQDQLATAWILPQVSSAFLSHCSVFQRQSYEALREVLREHLIGEWRQLDSDGQITWTLKMSWEASSGHAWLFELPADLETLDLSNMRKLMEEAKEHPHRVQAAKELLWAFQ